MTSQSFGQSPNPNDRFNGETADSFTLNVRLSRLPIRPPDDLVKQILPLPDIHHARPRVGPPPKAAILEDDHRRRVVILSTDDKGLITAYLLENFDLQPHIPALTECADQRQCAIDRMPLTGGLGCVAICLKDVLDKKVIP